MKKFSINKGMGVKNCGGKSLVTVGPSNFYAARFLEGGGRI